MKNADYDLVNKYVAQTGAYTYEMQLPGARHIVTADPENIKAILASQFEDFGKGKEVRETWKAVVTKPISTHFSFLEMGFL